MAYEYTSKEIVQKRLDSNIETFRIALSKIYSKLMHSKKCQVGASRDYRTFFINNLNDKETRTTWTSVEFSLTKNTMTIVVKGKENLNEVEYKVTVEENHLTFNETVESIKKALNFINNKLYSNEVSLEELVKEVIENVKKTLI